MSTDQNSYSLADSSAEVQFFCGFDWARNDHYFVLKTRSHKVLDEGYFQNTADGFRTFFQRLDAHRDGQLVSLIIENSRASALTLLGMKEWIILYPVNPSKTRKLIELEGSGKGKNDRRDSHLLCDYAISNHHRLRIEHERDPDILCLRELVETEDDLICDRTRLKNRVMSQVAQICPGLADLIAGKLEIKAYSEYLLRFDPRKLASDAKVEKHLKAHRVTRAKTVKDFLVKHGALKVLPLDNKLQAVHIAKLRSLVRQLHLIQEELCSCQCDVRTFFSELPNAEIYESMAGLGECLAPRMAALFGKNPEKTFANKQEVNAYFGQSPVTESSGGKDKERKQAGEHEKKKVVKRLSCNRFARHTTYLWSSSVARLGDDYAPWQRAFLSRCKERGDSTATRYRKLGQKMLAVLYTCLINGKPYCHETYLKNAHS